MRVATLAEVRLQLLMQVVYTLYVYTQLNMINKQKTQQQCALQEIIICYLEFSTSLFVNFLTKELLLLLPDYKYHIHMVVTGLSVKTELGYNIC